MSEINKYWLPKDYARCINKDCPLIKDCKRALEHLKGDSFNISCIDVKPKDGFCDFQIKTKPLTK